MKKKPHEEQSVIKSHFSDFRKRLHEPSKSQNGVNHEVMKTLNGFTVHCYRDRGPDQTLHFESEQAMNDYLNKQIK